MTEQSSAPGMARFLRAMRKDGTMAALGYAAKTVGRRLGPTPASVLREARVDLGRKLDRRLGGTVVYGPFKGMRLTGFKGFAGIRGAVLLGLYESEVLAQLAAAKDRDVLVDVGAGEGYYPVGGICSGLFQTAYAFELDDDRRAAITANATLNGVSGRIHVRGAAGPDFLSAIPQEELDRSVVLIDVEGFEFTLLTRETLDRLKDALVIVELHEFKLADGAERLQALREMAAETHRVDDFTTGARDLSAFPELDSLSDNERWLICSEGRKRRQRWMILTPRGND